MPFSGSLKQCQDHLHQQLLIEWLFVKAKETMEEYEGSQTLAAVVMMMESVPCILQDGVEDVDPMSQRRFDK